MNHVWGLLSHPFREMQVIRHENETVTHHYTHHVLIMAAIPVLCAFIGTTQIGWDFGDGNVVKLSFFTGFYLAVLFYALMLAAPLSAPALAAAKAAASPLAAAEPQIASGSAMIVDLRTNEVLFSSHPDLVRPIASITKVMTAMVVLDASLPLDEMLTVDISHTPEMKGIYSRVRLNSQISRKNMLLLALMSSENRAAASLAHHYPGGYDAFIRAMNAKAKALGMRNTHFVEPTGLSIHNVSTARDLTKLLIATKQYPLIGQLSTTREEMATFSNPTYTLPFRNTNHLVYRDNWNIQLTKTGFTNAAGHCLMMRTLIKNRPVTLVVMDAFGKYTHFADASRLRTWLETGKVQPVPEAALSYKRQKAAQMANNSVE
ncbi:D-alanyl-D-alanine endopeptidase [Cronobacter sakazakii]